MTNGMSQENSVIVFQPIIEIPIPKHFKLNITIGGVVGHSNMKKIAKKLNI